MNRSSALLLQIALGSIGVGALALLLWEPHLEGRNAGATLSEIYFGDPFLAYVYAGSTPFFVALVRAYGLCGHFRRRGAFSRETVAALRGIQQCGIAVIAFVLGAIVLILAYGDPEDRPAGVVMGGVVVVGASGGALAAAMAARRLEHALSRAEGDPGRGTGPDPRAGGGGPG